MNIYEKLQDARVQLYNSGIKKTGLNKHMNFNYYELDDFIPSTMAIFKELKLCPFISFNEDRSVSLTIVNSEAPEEKIIFRSPAEKCVIPKAQDIQNLGGEHTYQRRYLYLLALELTENDSVDPLNNNTKVIPNPNDQRTIPKSTTNIFDFETVIKSNSIKDVVDALNSQEFVGEELSRLKIKLDSMRTK